MNKMIGYVVLAVAVGILLGYLMKGTCPSPAEEQKPVSIEKAEVAAKPTVPEKK